ncbi:hypothetical protein [Hydrogenophaga taeniospiralis]|uniref:hypothetical protein n=1 Tax=Hydrogenophaga taeniospiralis TaxID=65656 RepID=UPI001CF9B464|nr:hypothetical protein [Hydrogenophaga taeniospiralis]
MFKITLITVSVLMLLSNAALAEGLSCTAAATEKKLAGAAKTSSKNARKIPLPVVI